MSSYTVQVLENAATEYEKSFVENLLATIIEEHCHDFNFSYFEDFFIVVELSNSADARFCLDDKMILFSRRLLDVLAKQCKYYNNNAPIDLGLVINDDTCADTILMIKQSVYHELCHMDNAHILKDLYCIGYHEDDVIKRSTAHYWVEYITHKDYQNFNGLECDRKFCFDFTDKNWDIATKEGYLFFLHCLPYFIYRWERCYPNDFIHSFGNFRNKNVKSIINKTFTLTKQILKHYPFSNYEPLIQLEKLFQKNAGSDKRLNCRHRTGLF